MNDDFIKKALEAGLITMIELGMKEEGLQKELDALKRQQGKIMLKMVSLAVLAEELPSKSIATWMARKLTKSGLTDAIRAVLRTADGWLTPTQIRDQLIRMNFDFERYKTPLTSIHTILGRLSDPEKDGEVESGTVEGKPAFRIKPRRSKFEALAEMMEGLPPDEVKKIMEKAAADVVEPRGKSKRKAKRDKLAGGERRMLTEGSLKEK